MKGKEPYRKPPDFVEQLVSIGMSVKSIDDMTFHPGDHEFFVKMNDTFQDALRKDMTKLIAESMLSANHVICDNVTNIVSAHTKEVGESYVIMMKAIERVDNNIKTLVKEVQGLKERQDKSDEKLKKEEMEIIMIKERLDAKKIRMDKLEKAFLQDKKDILEKLGDLEHDTLHLAEALDTDTTKVNKTHRLVRYIVVASAAILISALVSLTMIRNHSKKTKDLMEKYKMEYPELFRGQ